MLAKRFAGILPGMTFEEAIETTKIHSIAGALPPGGGLLRTRPFRSPHHTISDAGLIGRRWHWITPARRSQPGAQRSTFSG